MMIFIKYLAKCLKCCESNLFNSLLNIHSKKKPTKISKIKIKSQVFIVLLYALCKVLPVENNQQENEWKTLHPCEETFWSL